MSQQTRTVALEIIHDHAIARLRNGRALIDTGSPMTVRPPAIVEGQLGVPVRWLVGTDVLRRDRVLIDWPGRRVTVGGHALRGDVVELMPSSGLFQVPMMGPQGHAMAWLDTGAPLSYAPATAVVGLRPVGRRRDFHPVIGEFEVEVYRLSVEVASRRLDCLWGVLPAGLGDLLAGLGGTGWILGADFFRDRAIQLELGRNRLIDATASRGPQRVTRAMAGSLVAAGMGDDGPQNCGGGHCVAESRPSIRRVTTRLQGWRAWRLIATPDGGPRLMSLTRSDIWDGPVLVADRSPALAARARNAGIHAWRTPGRLGQPGLGAIAYGEVTLFGRVCVHELGFRAERARVDRLYLRACGIHRDAADESASQTGAYCGCDLLVSHEWLTHAELRELAARLEDAYQCSVTVDLERARVPSFHCVHQRQQRRLTRSR